MIQDGFKDTDPEYIGARLIFSQSQAPTRVAIGRRMMTNGAGEFEVTNEAAKTAGDFIVNWEHAPEGGNTFVHLAVPNLNKTPAFNEVLDSTWLDILPGGEITPDAGATAVLVAEINAARQMVNLGAALLGGTSVSLGFPVAESPTDAVRACRAVNTEWYAVTYLGATPDDILAIAQYIEAVRPQSVQMYTTDEELVLSNNPNSIFARLRA